MLKKIITIIATAIISPSLFASHAFYIGVTPGITTGDIQLKNSAGNKTHFGLQGMSAGLFAGYGGMLTTNFYLGGELFANGSNASSSSKTIAVDTETKVKMTYSYGLSLMPGVKVAPDTILYLKTGILRTRFDITQTQSASIATHPNSSTTGEMLGVGLQLALSKNLNIRGEYVYTSYQAFNAAGNHFSPTAGQLNAALIYKFV